MKIVVAMDSFKGSLSSVEAGRAVQEGICRADAHAQVKVLPLADGGEGTAYALTEGMGGEWITMEATGPLGKPVACGYGILPESKTAVIEMAAAAGLTLIPEARRNPMETTTYGVGEMIADGIKRGCRKFIIGIGGSGTNDGGIGMLQALGYGMLDGAGKPVAFGAKGLAALREIRDEGVIPALPECSFRIACDVTNPLCGEQGCSVVFGPQKGAAPDSIAQMDQWMEHYGKLAEKKYPRADRKAAGTGAAGGLGFAFLAFTDAVLESGVKLVLKETALQQYIKEAGLVVTGEGRLDGQTVLGKAPAGVAGLAKKLGKPVIAFSGCVAEDARLCNEAGVDAFFPILREPVTLAEAMQGERAAANLRDTAEQVFRLVLAVGCD